MNLLVLFENQLFDIDLINENIKSKFTIFMKEDFELFSYFNFHKHRTIFYISSMRHYAENLKKKKIRYYYETLKSKNSDYETSLLNYIKKNSVEKVYFFEIENKFLEKRILLFLKNNKIKFEILTSPMFLTSRENFKDYLAKYKKPFMKTFYEGQRKNLKILVDKKNEPLGGKWSFDTENRLSLPNNVSPPDVPRISPDKITKEVMKTVQELFVNSPGSSENFWLPVDQQGAKDWLDTFLIERFARFGPYEDAIPQNSDFVFHSVLTPFMNSGLLTPQYIIDSTISYANENKISIASVEGFIRQIIGWREFIRGIYQNFSEKQDSSNFFKHKKKLTQHWYDGTTGVAPLDNAIKKAVKLGYTHHIERLMIIGSLMLLLEIEPNEAHKWFMEMYVDSSDWVMGPNVYGMTLFSDGGIFATKPYFCGSNYYRKMGGYKATESWCDAVDGLYWGFIEKHKSFFSKNPRLSMMVKTLEKMDSQKKLKIYTAAEKLRNKLTK